jgi:hypothetical protein
LELTVPTAHIKGDIMRKTVAALIGGVALLGMLPLTASADPGEPQPTILACPTKTWYDIVGHSAYFVPASDLPIFKDGPGGDLSVTLTKNYTSTTTVSGATSAEIGGIVAKAKIEVSASLAQSVSLTVQHTYHRNISAGRYGHAQYGAWGQQVSWRRYYDGADCTTKLRASGTARIPSAAEVGWRYWETTT